MAASYTTIYIYIYNVIFEVACKVQLAFFMQLLQHLQWLFDVQWLFTGTPRPFKGVYGRSDCESFHPLEQTLLPGMPRAQLSKLEPGFVLRVMIDVNAKMSVKVFWG